MNHLRFTETNSGDDSAGRVFGLDGNLYLPLVGAVILGVLIAAGFGLVGGRFGIGAAIGAIPVGSAAVWVFGFRKGKPAGHDRDRIDAWLGGGNFAPGAEMSTARSHAGAPDGHFVRGMIVFGGPERGGVAAKGFRVEGADLRGASFARLNAFQDQVKSLLALVGPGRRCQFQWWVDADYRKALLQYREATKAVTDPAVAEVRNGRFARYWERMTGGALRREHLVIFLSIEVGGRPGPVSGRAGLERHYDRVLEELAHEFEEFAGALRGVFGTETTIEPLGDEEHFACVRRFLNPSVTRRTEENVDALFDAGRSLQENCWHGEGVGLSGGGFVLDGYHHAVLALSRWPQRTRPGIIAHLTGLPFLDYCVTVNVVPVAGRKEIEREEKVAERLRGEYAETPRASVLVALRKKERKVEALAGGFARPFLVTYVIRVWALSAEALREKVAAIQAAVNAMDGAQVFECALPTTAKKLFFATWPGWTHSSYRHRELYAEDSYLADLLPCSATFTGALEEAEALYDGNHGNLVGVATAARGSPQHAVLFGMTGAGKSSFVRDLLFQTAGHYAHTLIVEEGLSYRGFTESMGEKPIVIHPDADVTLNYLDTQGLPLTQLHVATGVALLSRMVGASAEPERLALRQAQLAQYVQVLYRDTFLDWARRKPAEAEHVRRFACGVSKWRTQLPAGTTPVEAFVDLRDRERAQEDEALRFLADLSDAEITRFAQEPATERLVAQTACAFYAAEDYPTHAALVELLAYARLPEHGEEEINRLATLLRAWTAQGQYGKLFDGPTTVSFDRKVVHLELGLIPDHAVEMKVAAGLLVSGLGRQHILAMPQAHRKRILFEEVARFLDTPGGESIVAEGYAQLRKHNCWCASIVQQYGRFKESRVRGAVIGNAKLFFFMRQADRADLVDLSRDLPIPEAAVEAIQRYPLPEQLPAEKRHSSLCYFAPTAQPPQCGTVRHVEEAPCGS
jgi:hypothetical protein